MQALLKVLHSPDVNTVYPAEHKFPQHCLLLYPLHPTSPQRLSSQHLLTNGGRGGDNTTKFQQNLANSKTLYVYTLPPALFPQNSLFSHVIPEFINWRSWDGWPPSPEDLSPVVMNWNQWSRVILLKELLGRILMRVFSPAKGFHFEPDSWLRWLATKHAELLVDKNNFLLKNPDNFSL